MHKVITERPRGGRSWASPYPRPVVRFDDLPKFQGLRRPYSQRKHFSDLLGPIKRWLQAQVGRPWNDAYSEACAVIKPDNVVRAHVRTHLLEFVERHTFMKNGEVWCHAEWARDGRLPVAMIPRRRTRFYVHPESGLLCALPAVRREKRRQVADARIRWLSHALVLCKVNGSWFACTVRPFPHRFERGDNPRRWDYVERAEINRSKACELYGRMVYCVGKQQLSRRQLKTYGLMNGFAPADRLARPTRLASRSAGAFAGPWGTVQPATFFKFYPAASPDYRRRQR